MSMQPPPLPSPVRRQQRRPASVALPRASPRSKSRQSIALASKTSDDDAKTAVKVAIRVRPPLTHEDPGYDLIPQRFRKTTCEVETPSSLSIQSAQGKKTFVFDRVFGQDVGQSGVWSYISDSIDSFLQGYNVSVLAYGQSGAGKSYTMGTSDPDDHSSAGGIINSAAAALLDKLQSASITRTGIRTPQRYSSYGAQSPTPASYDAEKTWQLKATYVEIYNEHLRDLLIDANVPSHERPQVAIREDTKGRILLTGLHQISINSTQDILDALRFGSAIRQTDATAINAQSSRSHAVFSLNLVQVKPASSATSAIEKRRSAPPDSLAGQDTITIDSKLHFVDLAGSERLKNTGASGDKAKEGISINAGLASLGKVIAQLSSRTHGAHISYRDSKLTRMLQDSLGGSAITYMVACINPVEFHLSETLNTLHYAQRARAIQTRPEIQQVSSESDKLAQIERLKAEITFLREQVSHNIAGNGRKDDGSEHKNSLLQHKLVDMQESYQALCQRHEKVISELGRSSTGEQVQIPENLLHGDASDRLQRSSSFASAVDTVISEYEKTIQTLEGSLVNTRSTLSVTESDLMQRESRIAYLEAATRQYQDRIQKMSDNEQHTAQYLQELENKLEAVASNEESTVSLISSLRKELKHAKESRASTEDYVTALERRLADADREQAALKQELERLDVVIERQRNLSRPQSQGVDAAQAGSAPQPSARPAEPTLSHSHMVAQALRVRASTNGTSSTGPFDNTPPSPLATDIQDFFVGQASHAEPVSPISEDQFWPGHPDHYYALEQHMALADLEIERSSFMADKVETLTHELFDLRGEHEVTINDLDDLKRRYAKALRQLQKLQNGGDIDTDDSLPQSDSFLEKAAKGQLPLRRYGGNSLQSSSSESLSPSDPSKSASLDASTAITSHGRSRTPSEPQPVDSLDAAERSLAHQQLAKDHKALVAEHRDSLIEINFLKSELQRARHTASPSPKVRSPLVRRKPSQDLITSMGNLDRANRSFASLRNIALDHFDSNPDVRQNFEMQLDGIMTELHSKTEKGQQLETELVTLRSKVEEQTTIITGLTRERSTLQSSSTDFSAVSLMRDQLVETQQQTQKLQDSHAAQQQKLQDEISVLTAQLLAAGRSQSLDTGDLTELARHRTMVEELQVQLASHQAAVDSHQQALASLRNAHEQDMSRFEAEQRLAAQRQTALQDDYEEAAKNLETELIKSQKRTETILSEVSAVLGQSVDQATIADHLEDLISAKQGLETRHVQLQNDHGRLRSAKDGLQRQVEGLQLLHQQALREVESMQAREQKNARLVQELEHQLNNSFGGGQEVQLQEALHAKQELEKEVEDSQARVSWLEAQVKELRRRSTASTARDSSAYYRDSLSPEAVALALGHSTSASSSTLRRSDAGHDHGALPSPPPVIPLPPLPTSPMLGGFGSFDTRALSPPPSSSRPITPHHLRSTTPDPSLIRQLEESESRLKAVEKHLFAEKQLTATLEEALVDLETAQTKTRSDVDNWRRKAVALEEQLASAQRAGTERASMQIEEERERRQAAERARRALEEQMRALERKKKGSRLNCF